MAKILTMVVIATSCIATWNSYMADNHDALLAGISAISGWSVVLIMELSEKNV